MIKHYYQGLDLSLNRSSIYKVFNKEMKTMAIQRQGPGNSYFRTQLENQEMNHDLKADQTKNEKEASNIVSKFTLRDVFLPLNILQFIVFIGIIGVIIYALLS